MKTSCSRFANRVSAADGRRLSAVADPVVQRRRLAGPPLLRHLGVQLSSNRPQVRLDRLSLVRVGEAAQAYLPLRDLLHVHAHLIIHTFTLGRGPRTHSDSAHGYPSG